MSTGIFIPITKCVHDIPYHGCTHETNSSSSLVFTGDIIKQQLEVELQGPRPLLFMNWQCVGSLMSQGIFIYMYDGYYDLQVLSLMARRLESLTMHLQLS